MAQREMLFNLCVHAHTSYVANACMYVQFLQSLEQWAVKLVTGKNFGNICVTVQSLLWCCCTSVALQTEIGCQSKYVGGAVMCFFPCGSVNEFSFVSRCPLFALDCLCQLSNFLFRQTTWPSQQKVFMNLESSSASLQAPCSRRLI